MPVPPAHTSLFRQAARSRDRARRPGSALALRQPAQPWLVMTLAAVAAGLVALLAGGSYTRQIRVAGALLPQAGLIRITALQAGVADDLRVAEGQTLRAGQPLLRLLNDRVSPQGGSVALNAALALQSQRDSVVADSAHQRLQLQLRIQALRARRAQVAAEQQQVEAQIALQRQRVVLAQETLSRYQALYARGYIAELQLQDRQTELLDQQQQLAALQRTSLTLQTQGDAALAELRSEQLQQERDAETARRALANIDQQLTDNHTRREYIVTAPQSGTVGAIAVRPGQMLSAGQVVATLVPADATLEAVLFAPSSAVGVVKAGMTVWLRYNAWPYRKYGQYRGRIREIAPTTLSSEELAWSEGVAVAARSAEPLYRVRVTLESQSVMANGQPVRLRPGMLLEASIATDRRRLYEWLLEPLVIVRGHA